MKVICKHQQATGKVGLTISFLEAESLFHGPFSSFLNCYKPVLQPNSKFPEQAAYTAAEQGRMRARVLRAERKHNLRIRNSGRSLTFAEPLSTATLLSPHN